VKPPVDKPNPNGQVVRFGVFELDLKAGELRRSGSKVKLQEQPLQILRLLLEHPGDVVTQSEIAGALWPDGTVVEYEHSVKTALMKLRQALGDEAATPRYVETLPRRGYRFIYPVDGVATRLAAMPGDPLTRPSADGHPLSPRRPRGLSRLERHRTLVLVVLAFVVAAAAGVTWFLKPHGLTQKDTVVLADFTNTTGDPVFDGTLRQGLSAQLEQSPFLNLLSDTRIAQTLALMAQPKDARLTPDMAREVCQRTGSAATIEGSIASLGSQYVLGLEAVNCHSGDTLAEEQVTANSKEHVLHALGDAATKLRKRLGESLASLEKYNAPPEDVTTSSLEALQAYSLGYRAHVVKEDWAAAVTLFQRAISLDPNFAMAWARLGTSYSDLGETSRGAEATRKAYKLRERVSERERFEIDSRYEYFVTGNLEAERKVDELWAQTYPHDPDASFFLAINYVRLGQYEKALAAVQEALRLDPGSGVAYGDLVALYLCLNRLDQARAAAQEARARNLDAPRIHSTLYDVDFLDHDAAGMEREAAELMGNPRYEDAVLGDESDTAAYAGQFVKARELTRRAVDSAERADAKERAAAYEVDAAMREVRAGNLGLARQQAQAALALSNDEGTEATSAIVLALAGDSARAAQLANSLSQQFPKDTMVQSVDLPMIRAASILGSNSTRGQEAVEALAAAAPYELGSGSSLYPAYLRGEAYLAAHQGTAAAAEFRKILDHPGIVGNDLIGALAHLGLGRAYALEAGLGGTAVLTPANPTSATTGGAPMPRPDALAKARAAYRDFFALWKNADRDIPILKQARAEYAKLI
jgi:eukaryotic-like serine/threonine-protein kinase